MGSRIMPAMSDGRSFTSYVSPGLYTNYLEGVFKTPTDTSFRHYLQNHSAEVLKVVNTLTAQYVKPPKMPKCTLKVQGGANARMTEARFGVSDHILPRSYYNTVDQFNNTVRG